jgi:spore coat protein H
MVMTIRAVVNKSDYDNMLRTYWLKDDIDADLEVDGVPYPKGEISFRGTTSLNFPKKGFKVKFSKKALYQGHTKRFDLSASYTDKSLIRERLCFDLFGQTGVVSSSAWHVDFIIQSKEGQVFERGLYTGIEHVDEYFFKNRGREAGSLYKADGAVINGVFVGATLAPQDEATLKILYDKQHTKKAVKGFLANLFRAAFRLPPIEIADADDEDYSDLDSFIRTINGLNADTISNRLDAIMDVDTYLDWLAVNTLVQSNDTYHKNYYLHSRVEDDKWEVMPWDYDLSFGRNWNDHCDGLCDDLSEGTSIKGSNQMLNELSRRVFNNPVYIDRLRDKLLQLLETEFTEEKLFQEIDTYYEEITPLAHMDTRKWPTDEEFERERDRLKDWIRRRRHFLFKELGTVPLPSGQADTIVTELGFNKASLIEGDEIGFEATVKNVGGAVAGPTVGVAFLVDGVYVTFGTSSTLAPGASRQIKSVSSWKAVAGDHTLTAVVDDVNRYPEISETNNTLETRFQVSPKPSKGLPDVVIKDIAFERNELGQARLAALVSNIGQVETPDIVGVAFFVDDQYTTFGTTSPMKAGESCPVRAVSALSLSGSHKITAVVDDVNRFPEMIEQNNVLTEQINFGDQEQVLADTIILNVTTGNGRFSEGDAITFEAVVQNIGIAPTGDVVGVAFLVDGQYITFGTSPPIPSGAIQNIPSVSTWRAVAGQHRLLAIVDDVNRYPEISETNNRFELDFQVFERDAPDLPDSIVRSIGFETQADGQIVLTAEVANIGNAPTPDVVGVAFFVDGQYVTYGVAQPMAVNAAQTIRAVTPLPLRGKHQITAIVDDVNRYDEISHRNNAMVQEMTFG